MRHAPPRTPVLAIGRALFCLLLLGIVALPSAAQEAAPDSAVVRESDLSDEARAEASLHELELIRATIETMISESRGLRGEEQQLKRVAVLEQVKDLEEVAERLAGLIGKLDVSIADSARTIAEPVLRYSPELFLRALDYQSGQLSRDRSQRKSASTEELARIELEITERHQSIDEFARQAARSLERLDRIDIDVDDLWEELELFLSRRAESLGGRLQLAVELRHRLQERTRTSEEDDAAASVELALVEQRINALVSSLKLTTAIMSTRDMPTANYDQLVIESTGSVTEHILDPEVLKALIQGAWRQGVAWTRLNGPTLLVWLGLIVLSIVLTHLAFRAVWLVLRLLLRPALLLQNLVNGLIRPTASVIGLVIGLWILGVDPRTLLAGIGVLSIVVGLALQDSLGNLAAGVFILVYRPYDVDEIVQAGGVVGRVKEMGLANTTIITFDRRRMFVPNKKIWSEVIENRSAEPLRRSEAVVRIRYDEDIDGTIEYLAGVMAENELVLAHPETEVFVSRLEDSWVELSVWPWTRAEHWWSMQTNLRRLLRLALDERGITHAFPRYEIGSADQRTTVDPQSPEA